MRDVILVANCGSSSLKIAIFAVQNKQLKDCLYQILLEKKGDKLSFQINSQEVAPPHTEKLTSDPISLMIEIFVSWWDKEKGFRLIATGHRIVHGGTIFSKPIIVTELVTQQIKDLIPLDPLHQPYNLQALTLFQQKYQELAHIACFDTAFHTLQPTIAKTFGLPKEFYDKGIYRYGFHGLSYQWISKHFKDVAQKELPKRVIIGHLGNGSSMCAVENGISIATTMGFSVVEGLLMGTRCGSIDPGVILHLLTHEKMTVEQVTKLLYRGSGLLGVSNESSDLRVLLASSSNDAKFAIELFVYKLQLEIGRLTAALGGLDCIIFTAGIGQNSPIIRKLITEKLGWLGVKLDEQKNLENNYCISEEDSDVTLYVIPTNEERVIAEDVISILQGKTDFLQI